jgi:hypothetical protein
MRRVVHLGPPLVDVSTDALAEAALVCAIVGFAWPICSGRQCWETASQQGEVGRGLRLGEGLLSKTLTSGTTRQLGFHKWCSSLFT